MEWIVLCVVLLPSLVSLAQPLFSPVYLVMDNQNLRIVPPREITNSTVIRFSCSDISLASDQTAEAEAGDQRVCHGVCFWGVDRHF